MATEKLTLLFWIYLDIIEDQILPMNKSITIATTLEIGNILGSIKPSLYKSFITNWNLSSEKFYIYYFI